MEQSGTDLFLLTEKICCSQTSQSHFPEPDLPMDITADSMVMCTVPTPAKYTMLNTVTSKYGQEDFGHRQQKSLQSS